MKKFLPVFSEESEIYLWKSISAAEEQTQPERRTKQYRALLQTVLGSERVPSQILERMILLARSSGAEDWKDDIPKLLALQKQGDCLATLAAASCMAKEGLFNAAYGYLDTINQASDIARFNQAKGDILMAMNNREGAVAAYKTALRSNPMQQDIYVKLQAIDSSQNWMAIGACERMAAHLEYSRPPAEPRGADTELFEMYDEFYNGDRSRAESALMSSEGFQNGEWDYVLLAARMSVEKHDIPAAMEYYKGVMKALEFDVAVMCEIASFYLKEDPDPAAALSIYRTAEGIDPGNIGVVHGLVRTYSKMDRAADAVDVLKVFLKTESADLDEYNYAAERMLELHQFDDANTVARQTILSYPDDARALVVMSKVAIERKDFSSARHYAKSAMRALPDDPVPHAQMSLVYTALKMPRFQIKYAEKAVQIDPSSVEANVARLEAYFQTGDMEKTVQAAEKVLEIDPDNAYASDLLSKIQIERAVSSDSILPNIDNIRDAVYMITRLEGERRFEDAEKACDEVLGRFEKTPEILQLRGNALFAMGKYLKASASFADALSLCPNSAVLWHSKGLQDEKLGDLASASEAFDRAVILDSANPHYWTSRGCINQQRGRNDVAIEAFNRAIDLDPDSPYPLIRKASLVQSLGKYDDALAYMNIAQLYIPDDPEVTAIKMKILNSAGRHREAKEIGEQMLKNNVTPSVIAQMVEADIGLDDPSEAVALVENGLTSYPDSIELLKANRDLKVYTKEWNEVIRICYELTRMFPEDRRSQMILVDACVKTGRTEEANAIYKGLENSVSILNTGDQASVFSIAKSLLDVDDIQGASRLADRLITMDPDNEEYIAFRARVFIVSGSLREADTFISEYLEKNPGSVHMTELLGDIKSEKGQIDDAVDVYARCLLMLPADHDDMERCDLLVKLATLEEKMRKNNDAIQHYAEAVDINPYDANSSRRLAQLLLMSDDKQKALSVISQSLSAEESAASYAVLAGIYQAMDDAEGVRDAYHNFIRFDNLADADAIKVVTALDAVGLTAESESFRKFLAGVRVGSADVSSDVPLAVKKCAERMMRRAYMRGIDVTDPQVRDLSDQQALTDSALEYLNDIPKYGEVIPGMINYSYMETLSYNVVSAPRSKGLENLTVATAYVAGKARNADEAKALVAYVRSAKESPIPSDISDEIRKYAQAYAPGTSLETIMMNSGCGIMTARIIQAYI